MGATLLIFINKTDVGGCLTDEEIHKVVSDVMTETEAQADEVI